MKSKARRLISLIVTLVMAFTVMSMSMVGMTAGVAESKTYSEIKKYEVTYGGKLYRFAMNGQTGKLVGELPIDKGKKARAFWIPFLIAAVIAFIIIFHLTR